MLANARTRLDARALVHAQRLLDRAREHRRILPIHLHADVVHDFGKNNPGTNGRPGASNWQHPGAGGGTTGGNNSSLCGNGAAPPPFTP